MRKKKIWGICRIDYYNCQCYNSDIDLEFHCIKDSNVGYCLIEKRRIESIHIKKNLKKIGAKQIGLIY